MKPAYRLKAYKHSQLKWVVRAKIGGKWVRKYFRKKAEAQTYCEQKNVELLNQGKESIEFPSWLRVMAQAAHEQLQPHGRTIADAVAFYLAHMASTKRAVLISEAVMELVQNRRGSGVSKRYCHDLELRLGRFVRDFSDRGTTQLSAKEIDEWLVGLDLAPVTRNTFRRDLRTLFSFCLKRDYCDINPVEHTSLAKEVPEPVGILTVDQMTNLLNAAAEEAIVYLAIGAFAGLRAAETERLDWSEIDLEGGLIEVKAAKSKTARRRLVKIPPNLAAWLERAPKRSGEVAPRNLRKLLLAARTKAGLEEWPSNALRHSYASHHIAHFNDAAALALELGHTNTATIFQHYREVVKPRDAARYWQIFPAADAAEKQ